MNHLVTSQDTSPAFLRMMSWQDYKIYRFREICQQLYPADFRRVIFPCNADRVTCLLPGSDDDDSGEKKRNTLSLAFPTYQFQSATREGDACTGEWIVGAEDPDQLKIPRFKGLIDMLRLDPSADLAYVADEPIPGAPFMLRSQLAWIFGAQPPLRGGISFNPYWLQVGLFGRSRTLVSPRERNATKQTAYKFPEILQTSGLFNRLVGDGGEKFSVWADFYRDFFLSPWAFQIRAQSGGRLGRELGESLENVLLRAGNIRLDEGNYHPESFSSWWSPSIFITITEDASQAILPFDYPQRALRMLLVVGDERLPEVVDPGWDLCLAWDQPRRALPLLSKPWQGWGSIADVDILASLLDVRLHAHHLRIIEAQARQFPPPKRKLSVVITTYRRDELLQQALESLTRQNFPRQDFEILVVNNDPSDPNPPLAVARLQESYFTDDRERIRLVECPIPGLSYARNAGIAEARGEVLCFLDDDALARPDWLEQIWQAFESRPDLGVAGGHIFLKYPQPRPPVLKAGLERFWTQFITPQRSYTEVQNYMEFPWGANWCARRQALLEMGGFRGQYGRRKRDFSGGEELIAAILAQRLGFDVAIQPTAEVDHQPEQNRFTYTYLRKTIIAQIIIHYHMNRDQYLPRPITVKNNWRGAQRFARNVKKMLRMAGGERQALAVEYFYMLQAWARLFFEQGSDNLRRWYLRNSRV